jgi:hypothetical protein
VVHFFDTEVTEETQRSGSNEEGGEELLRELGWGLGDLGDSD